MRVKILETRNIKGNNSKDFRNYQVSFEEKKVWISELAYTMHPDLLSFEDEFLILKDPVKDNFILNEKKNKNGKFLTLTPKQTSLINEVEVMEDSIKSTELESNQNNSETLNSEGNLKSEIIYDYLDKLGDKEKLFINIDRAIIFINQLQYDDFKCIENLRVNPKLKELYKGVLDNPSIIQLINQQINRVVGILKNIENDIQKVKLIIETHNDTVISADEIDFICETLVKLKIIHSIIEKTISPSSLRTIIYLDKIWKYFKYIKERFSTVLEETTGFNCFKFQLENNNQLQGLLRLEKLSEKFSFSFEGGNTLTMPSVKIQELKDEEKIIDKLLDLLNQNSDTPIGIEVSKVETSTINKLGLKPEVEITDKNIINEIIEEEAKSKADLENEQQIVSDFEVLYEIDKVKTSQQIIDKSFIKEVTTKEDTPKGGKTKFLSTSVPPPPKLEKLSKRTQAPLTPPKVEAISSPENSKASFINELLRMSNRKDVSEKVRERVIDLVSKEAVGNDELLNKIYNDVKEIKKRVFEDDTSTQKEGENDNLPKSKEESQLPKYFNPANLFNFLFNYNQNPVLKYTCHDIDSDGLNDIIKYCKTEQYDFQKHTEIIKEVYATFVDKYPAPKAVKGLIRGYLTGKDYYGIELEKGWSSDSIILNWSHSDLISWSKANPGFPPNPSEGLIEQYENVGFEFKRFESLITGKTVQNFRELVIHFKNLFHIRRDNSLKDLIEYKNLDRKWNQTIDFIIEENEFPKNIEFFTDVDKLMQSYTKIIELIIEQCENSQSFEKPRVKLSFLEKEGSLEFSIHHLNSVYGKTIVNAIERPGVAYTNLISKQINGLCNFYIRADFGQEKFAKINIWNSKERKAEEIERFKGVEHIFEFPKK